MKNRQIEGVHSRTVGLSKGVVVQVYAIRAVDAAIPREAVACRDMVGSVALVHGEAESHDTVATIDIRQISRRTFDAAIICDLVPHQAVACYQRIDLYTAMMDSEIEGNHAVAPYRIRHHIGGMVVLIVNYLTVPDGGITHLLGIDSCRAMKNSKIQGVGTETFVSIGVVVSISASGGVWGFMPSVVVTGGLGLSVVGSVVDSQVKSDGAVAALGVGEGDRGDSGDSIDRVVP